MKNIATKAELVRNSESHPELKVFEVIYFDKQGKQKKTRAYGKDMTDALKRVNRELVSPKLYTMLEKIYVLLLIIVISGLTLLGYFFLI